MDQQAVQITRFDRLHSMYKFDMSGLNNDSHTTFHTASQLICFPVSISTRRINYCRVQIWVRSCNTRLQVTLHSRSASPPISAVLDLDILSLMLTTQHHAPISTCTPHHTCPHRHSGSLIQARLCKHQSHDEKTTAPGKGVE